MNTSPDETKPGNPSKPENILELVQQLDLTESQRSFCLEQASNLENFSYGMDGNTIALSKCYYARPKLARISTLDNSRYCRNRLFTS
jgi:hypothetical protein